GRGSNRSGPRSRGKSPNTRNSILRFSRRRHRGFQEQVTLLLGCRKHTEDGSVSACEVLLDSFRAIHSHHFAQFESEGTQEFLFSFVREAENPWFARHQTP